MGERGETRDRGRHGGDAGAAEGDAAAGDGDRMRLAAMHRRHQQRKGNKGEPRSEGGAGLLLGVTQGLKNVVELLPDIKEAAEKGQELMDALDIIDQVVEMSTTAGGKTGIADKELVAKADESAASMEGALKACKQVKGKLLEVAISLGPLVYKADDPKGLLQANQRCVDSRAQLVGFNQRLRQIEKALNKHIRELKRRHAALEAELEDAKTLAALDAAEQGAKSAEMFSAYNDTQQVMGRLETANYFREQASALIVENIASLDGMSTQLTQAAAQAGGGD